MAIEQNGAVNPPPPPEPKPEPEPIPEAVAPIAAPVTVDTHRRTLAGVKEALVALGAMQRWEADHLFEPIFKHLGNV